MNQKSFKLFLNYIKCRTLTTFYVSIQIIGHILEVCQDWRTEESIRSCVLYSDGLQHSVCTVAIEECQESLAIKLMA